MHSSLKCMGSTVSFALTKRRELGDCRGVEEGGFSFKNKPEKKTLINLMEQSLPFLHLGGLLKHGTWQK